MLRLRRKKKKEVALDERRLDEVMQGQLGQYVRKEELQEFFDKLDKDRKRRELWNSLSTHRKLSVLRFALGRRGKGDVKP